MSKQLTIRLADDLVAFIDRCVEDGKAPSRAAVVSAAIDRERRRAIAERDVSILAQAAGGDDLGDLAAYASRMDLADLD